MSRPRCARPELSGTSVCSQKAPIASATKPRYHASRAAWICPSRSARRGFCLLEDARVRVGQRRAPEERPRRRRGQPGLRRRGPVGAKGRLERRDAFGDARQDGVAVARVADRRLEHVAKRWPFRARAASGARRRTHRARRRRAAPCRGRGRARARGSARSSPRPAQVPARTRRARRRARRSRGRSAGRRPARSGAARRPAARTPQRRPRRTRCRRPRAAACRPRKRASASRRPSRTCRGAQVVW